MFTNLKNKWFGTGIETTALSQIIENLIWTGDLEVSRVRSGLKISTSLGKFVILDSEMNANGMVWVPIKLVQAYSHAIHRNDLLSRKVVINLPEPKAGDVLYVACSRCYKQFKHDPKNPQHILVVKLGLCYRDADNLVQFSRSAGFKAKVFYSISGVPEAPDTFLSKIVSYNEPEFVARSKNFTDLW